MPRFNDDLLSEVISDCFRAFSLPEKVRPIHLSDIWLEKLDDWESSPGMPWKDYGYRTKADVACDSNALSTIKQFWNFVNRGRDMKLPLCYGPMIPSRRHPVEQKNRHRRRSIFWGYPCAASFQEACFALPLFKGYNEINTPIAYGYRDYEKGGQELYSRFRDYKNILCLDYKNFARNLCDWLIQIAFDILGSNVNWIEYRGYEMPHCEKLHKTWKKLVDYFQRTPFKLRHGTKYCKPRGIGSGNYFTEMIYSIVNYIVIQYCVRFQGLTVLDQLVLGDDCLVATSGQVDISHLLATAGKFDMVINLNGLQMSNSVNGIQFLGHIIERDGFGKRRLR